jgi:CTP:molybdopterin cytidylyltransferase MocA
MTKLVVLIPAAGAARRMRGTDKLLEPVAGEPVLRRVARAGAAAGEVVVTLQPGAAARRGALTGSDARLIEVPDWAEGMAASLRAGARAATVAGATGVLILLADMPEIEAADVERFLAAHMAAPDVFWRGTTEDGRPGHPVLIPARVLGDLAKIVGDEGARGLLNAKGADVRPLVLPGDRAVLDLDTPEDWAAWRARTGL